MGTEQYKFRHGLAVTRSRGSAPGFPYSRPRFGFAVQIFAVAHTPDSVLGRHLSKPSTWSRLARLTFEVASLRCARGSNGFRDPGRSPPSSASRVASAWWKQATGCPEVPRPIRNPRATSGAPCRCNSRALGFLIGRDGRTTAMRTGGVEPPNGPPPGHQALRENRTLTHASGGPHRTDQQETPGTLRIRTKEALVVSPSTGPHLSLGFLVGQRTKKTSKGGRSCQAPNPIDDQRRDGGQADGRDPEPAPEPHRQLAQCGHACQLKRSQKFSQNTCSGFAAQATSQRLLGQRRMIRHHN